MLILPLLSLLLGLLAVVSAGGPPDYPSWPPTFHASCWQSRGGDLALVDLWYDYPGGHNLNIITSQGGEAKGPLFDNETPSGSTYYYTPQTGECSVIEMGVGLLPPNWLEGATYLGQEGVGIYPCTYKWEKGDSDIPHTPFVTYWSECGSDRPVKWIFFDGAVFNVIRFEEGVSPPSDLVQIPDYCPSGHGSDGGGGLRQGTATASTSTSTSTGSSTTATASRGSIGSIRGSSSRSRSGAKGAAAAAAAAAVGDTAVAAAQMAAGTAEEPSAGLMRRLQRLHKA